MPKKRKIFKHVKKDIYFDVASMKKKGKATIVTSFEGIISWLQEPPTEDKQFTKEINLWRDGSEEDILEELKHSTIEKVLTRLSRTKNADKFSNFKGIKKNLAKLIVQLRKENQHEVVF